MEIDEIAKNLLSNKSCDTCRANGNGLCWESADTVTCESWITRALVPGYEYLPDLVDDDDDTR